METPSPYQLIHQPSGLTIARVLRAETWLAQGWGVLGRRHLPGGAGLWLPGASSIHTCFVQFPLDLVFLDRDLRALRLLTHVPPWRCVWTRGAAHTLELGAGTLAQAGTALHPGELWTLDREESALK